MVRVQNTASCHPCAVQDTASCHPCATYNDRGEYDEAHELCSRAISDQESRHLDRFARGKLATMHTIVDAVVRDAG